MGSLGGTVNNYIVALTLQGEITYKKATTILHSALRAIDTFAILSNYFIDVFKIYTFAFNSFQRPL